MSISCLDGYAAGTNIFEFSPLEGIVRDLGSMNGTNFGSISNGNGK